MKRRTSIKLASALFLGSMLLPISVPAQTREDLLKDGSRPDQITTYGMGYAQQRHSLTVSIRFSLPISEAWQRDRQGG